MFATHHHEIKSIVVGGAATGLQDVATIYAITGFTTAQNNEFAIRRSDSPITAVDLALLDADSPGPAASATRSGRAPPPSASGTGCRMWPAWPAGGGTLPPEQPEPPGHWPCPEAGRQAGQVRSGQAT